MILLPSCIFFIQIQSCAGDVRLVYFLESNLLLTCYKVHKNTSCNLLSTFFAGYFCTDGCNNTRHHLRSTVKANKAKLMKKLKDCIAQAQAKKPPKKRRTGSFLHSNELELLACTISLTNLVSLVFWNTLLELFLVDLFSLHCCKYILNSLKFLWVKHQSKLPTHHLMGLLCFYSYLCAHYRGRGCSPSP